MQKIQLGLHQQRTLLWSVTLFLCLCLLLLPQLWWLDNAPVNDQLGLAGLEHTWSERYGAMLYSLITGQQWQGIWLLNQAQQWVWCGLAVLSLVALSLTLWAGRYRQLASHKPYLMAYASQTGTALQLAKQLHQQVQPWFDLAPLAQLTPDALLNYQGLVFVVSTYGDGEPPDSALNFVASLEKTPVAQGKEFSILALGDRQYQAFCAFGHQLSSLLQAKGHRPLQQVMELDGLSWPVINQWWHSLAQALGFESQGLSQQYQDLALVSNSLLNPQSKTRQLHLLRFNSMGLDYQAGDLLAVQPKANPEMLRQRILAQGWQPEALITHQGQCQSLLDWLMQLEWRAQQAETAEQLLPQLSPIQERLYSIASYSKQWLDLMVRQHWRAEGVPGLASGYLCALPQASHISARIQPHPSFRLQGDQPLIMLAAGTGLAPFLGFMAQKAAWGSRQQHWLIFGEQYQEQDHYAQSELQTWQQQGLLTWLDCAWSRSQAQYVQHVLLTKQARLEQMLAQGAYIYVCGSKAGFGESVLAQLGQLLDDSLLKERLRTDLY